MNNSEEKDNLHIDHSLDENDTVESKGIGTGKLVVIVFFTSIISLVIGATGFFALCKYNPNLFGDSFKTINQLEKEVTITDNGIADAVDKIKESVVIVKTYSKNKLYATGTGFIYKKTNGKYYFITNYHVIEDGDQIRVQFYDESESVVKVEKGDKYADIVVLSIETKSDYPVVEIGNNTETRVGDTVFAMGSPVDYSMFSWSVTRGVLSGKDREVKVSVDSSAMYDYVMNVLQTDTAINGGNSGGPLCNVNGQVIGVTNMKLASEQIEGMAFAIPIELVASYADAVINGEDVSRPYLGVNLTNANTAAASTRYGIDMQDGVVIDEVFPNSSAEKAGLKKGDIIKKVDGVEIKDVATFRFQLFKYRIGETISIEFIRGGSSRVVDMKLEASKN